MKILFFGDVMGKSGRLGIAKILPGLRAKYAPDLVMANTENLAHGRGLTRNSLKDLQNAGVDVFTGGDHSLENEQGLPLFADENLALIRPINLVGEDLPGKTFLKIEKNGILVIVFNLVGQLFMKKDYPNPFVLAEKFVEEHKKESKIIIVEKGTAKNEIPGWR